VRVFLVLQNMYDRYWNNHSDGDNKALSSSKGIFSLFKVQSVRNTAGERDLFPKTFLKIDFRILSVRQSTCTARDRDT
jgi:hypothetical protein